MAHTGRGPGSSRWVGYARDDEEVIWLCGTGCFGNLQRVRTAATQFRRKLGDDASDPALIFAEPRVGYRMEQSGTKRPEEG